MMKISKKRLCVAILPGLLFASQSSWAQDVGRLFLTPAERAYLEQLRIRSLQPQPVEPEPELEPQAPVVEPEKLIYSHGGTLRRSDGSFTIWLNNQAYRQNELPNNVRLLRPYTQGRLIIRDPDNGREYEVKPGQVLDLDSGRLLESYQAPEPATDAGL